MEFDKRTVTRGAARVGNPLLAAEDRPLPRRVAVVGAGTIGPDIAYYLASSLPDPTLVLVDVDQGALDRAAGRIAGYVDKGLAKRKLTQEQAEAVRAGLVPTLDYGALAGCDWVIEAATEDLALKRRIFGQIEAVVGEAALITSNTSSLPAARLFCELGHPGRATVTHFFAPAFRNPAVEVVRWDGVDPAVVAHLRRVFCATGKVPLVTADAVCFMLDRVFDNWCNDAALLLDRAGATAAEVDSVAAELVHAGPFFVLNLANGNPIIVETNTLQAAEEGEHYRPAPVFRSVDRWRTVGPGERVEVAPETAARVRDGLIGVLLSQAFDVVDRDIGASEDLELGCRLALGFKRGPFDLMAELGDEEVARIVGRYGEERPGMPGPGRALAAYQDFRRHVLVDDVGDVKVITLRRPDALNALDDTMTDEVLAVLRACEGDPAVRGFVVVGYGPRAFCAGADIGRFPEVLGRAEAAAQYARDCSRLLVHLDATDKPVVAALNGMALGGGLELALRCREVVAQREAWLQFPEVTLGIAPGIGGMVVPYRRWPKAAPIFDDMLRTGRRLDAAVAHELGVVTALADSYAGLIAAACARVAALADGAPADLDGPVDLGALEAGEARGAKGEVLSAEVVGLIGEAIREAAAAPTLAEALEVGYRAFGRSACTAAAREGIGAFLERRRPDFAATG